MTPTSTSKTTAETTGDESASRPAVTWALGIVPVQEWISEARRSRDLLAGSAILSWLMARLLRPIDEAGEVVLPALAPGVLDEYSGTLAEALASRRYSIPNRASGHLGVGLGDARKLFEGLDRTLAECWSELVEEVDESARKSAAGPWGHLRSHALGAPCPFRLVWSLREGDNLEAIDELYAARKRTRDVRPHEGRRVPKCTQCGRREAAGGPGFREWDELWRERLGGEREIGRGLRLEATERLCEVCLVKRFAGYLHRPAFPSTSDIASAPWRRRLRELDGEGLGEALDAVDAAAGAVPGYGEEWADRSPLLYSRTAHRERRAAGTGDERERAEAIDALEAAQRRLADAIRSWNGKRRARPEEAIAIQPAQYLAVVIFDGDDFGERLRQDRDRLSTALHGFQEGIRSALAGGGGVPKEHRALADAHAFFLGGDEGLLLVPAAEALAAPAALHSLWCERMPEPPDRPTLSVGVAVFDRERPLGDAIDAARAALARAKEGGKDRLAVTTTVSSGSRWTAMAPWGQEWERMAAAVDLVRRGDLASGWPHDVERFLASLDSAAWEGGEAALTAIRVELRRLTKRRTPARGDRGLAEENWSELSGDNWMRKQPLPDDLDTLPRQLHLVAFLARQAGGAVAR